MVVVAGDFWNPRAATVRRQGRRALGSDFLSYRVLLHTIDDDGMTRALRAGDRMEISDALRASFPAIYRHRIELAERAGVEGRIRDRLREEAERVSDALRGFQRRGSRYELVVAGWRGEPGARLPDSVGWEFRRLREAVEGERVVVLGFDRPPPRRAHSRYHYTPSQTPGLVHLAGHHGATPWLEGRGPHSPVWCILSDLLQTSGWLTRPRTPAAFSLRRYSERLGYVALHELLGHGVARLRGVRERHRLPHERSFTRGDRVASWLAGALLEPVDAHVPSVDVAWSWDPDGGPDGGPRREP